MQSQHQILPCFESVYEQYAERVRNYLRRLAPACDVEDVLQTTFMKVSAGLAGFEGKSALSTWIFRIATNAAMDRLRERAGKPESGSQGLDRVALPSVERQLIRKEMGDCLREMVDRLPANYRTVLVLADLEGFTPAEIATVLDVSLDAAKIRLHRARAKLRSVLEAECRFYHDDGLACDRKFATTQE